MYLGIEIGGTKLQVAVGDGRSDQLLETRREPIEREAGAAAIRQQLATIVPPLVARHGVKRIGIGFGGPVQQGTVLKSHQVAGWESFPLGAWCQESFGVAASIGNDCDAAALAEACWGAGRDAAIVLYVTVGTGVGGGLVVDRRLQGAGRPAVAEIGHLRPGLEAAQPTNTVESMASGLGIAATARDSVLKLPSDDPMVLQVLEACQGDPKRLTAKLLAGLLDQGNRIAESAFKSSARMLGWAIAQAVTLTAAEAVVVGGGVALVGEQHFFRPLREYVRDYVFPPLQDSYRVVPAALGEWVVVHGALALAAQHGEL